jgi:amino-acid N-acetyltransferase
MSTVLTARARRMRRDAGRVPRLASHQRATTYRRATRRDAPAIHALIAAHQDEGHLLPRTQEEIVFHAPRFIVAVRHDSVVGCAELAPLGAVTAEVRSLVVDRSARGDGLGARLVRTLRQRASAQGFERLCAFTHDATYFVRLGFEVVPHDAVPEKIARDCVSCALFQRCGQHAVVLPLGERARG